MPRIPLVAVVPLIPLIAAPIARAERLPIKTYSTADGLPRDQVRYILPDSRGFLWFCTGDGIANSIKRICSWSALRPLPPVAARTGR